MSNREQRRTILQQRIAAALRKAPPQPGAYYQTADIDSLVHELSVYHEELEFQNDELRAAQARLQAIQERYADLFERAPVGYIVIDGDYHILLVNDTLSQLLNVTSQTMMGQSLTHFVDPESQDTLYLHLRGIAGETQPRTAEILLTGRTGPVPVRIESVPDFHSGNLFTRIAVVDITHERDARLALADSQMRYRLMFDMADDIVLVCALDAFGAAAEITDANEAACQVLGYTHQELVGAAPGILTAGAPLFLEAKTNQLCKEGRVLFETTLTGRNGTLIPVEIHASSYEWKGRPMVLCIARDISERLRLESDRQEMERRRQEMQKWESLGVLAGGIAHDFNNLLAVIANDLEIMRLRLRDGEPALRNIDRARQAVERGVGLTRQMAAYTGHASLAMQTVDLNDIAGQALTLFNSIVPAHIQVSVDFAPDLPLVWADPIQVQQMIISVLTNAMESFSDNNGEIVVTTSYRMFTGVTLKRSPTEERIPEGRYVCLSVKDNGSGMDTQTLARVFEPFFTTRFAGRGLGMSAVLGILRGHHGAILLDSEVDRGTSVCIILPPAAPAQPAPNPPGVTHHEEMSPPAPAATLLIVEDEEYLREACQEVFSSYGYTVYVAADGKEAIEQVSAHRDELQCVLLDLSMPGMSGLETYLEVHRLQPELPVVVTSGYDAQDVVGQFPSGAIAAFCQKPYSMKHLRQIVQDVIKSRVAI